MITNKESQAEADLKKLERFKKQFKQLRAKFPEIMVSTDLDGNVIALILREGVYSNSKKVYLNH